MEKRTSIHPQFVPDKEYAAKYRQYERIYNDQCSCPMPQIGEVYDIWSVGRQQSNEGLTVPRSLGRMTCLVEYTHRFVFAYDNQRFEVTKNDLKAGLIVAKHVEATCPFQLIPVAKAG
jgi:hypothetical protein